MNTIGIVALSLLAGLFLALIVAGLGVMVWLALRLKRSQDALKTWADSVYAETGAMIEAYQGELKSILESSKTGFAAIRNETKATLESHREKLEKIQETHRTELQFAISKINADALQSAAARSIQACLRLEKAVGIFQAALLNVEERSTHEYGPEEFAPEEDTRFGTPPSGYSVGQAAELDSQEDREEVGVSDKG